MPGRHLSAATPQVLAGDREVKLLMALNHPRIVVFGNLLSAEECEEIIALARTRLARSETVETRTGESEVNAARTSDGMFFQPGEFPVCARFEARIAALLGWPLENGEGLQVLRYRPGAEYKPHYDYFDPAEPGTPTILKRGGQRVGSLVCYLNTPDRGRSHRLSRRRPRRRAGPGQRRLLQLRPAAPVDQVAARRRSGPRRREVGCHQVDARGPLRIRPAIARALSTAVSSGALCGRAIGSFTFPSGEFP